MAGESERDYQIPLQVIVSRSRKAGRAPAQQVGGGGATSWRTGLVVRMRERARSATPRLSLPLRHATSGRPPLQLVAESRANLRAAVLSPWAG